MMGFTELTSILGIMTLGFAIGRLSEYLLIGRKKVKRNEKD